MKSKSASRLALSGPCEAYMNSAKKAAMAAATIVPITGRVDSVRASRVRS